MPQEFESENYRTKMIERFEEMLKTESNHFLDAEIYLDIIEYYQEVAQYENALKASDMALELHPYSTELMLNKAQVLVNMFEIEKAAQIIKYLKNMMPNDADVMLLEESIATQQGNHELSINILEQLLAYSYQDKDEVYARLAYSHQCLHNYETAVKFYKKSLILNQNQQNVIEELLFCLDVLDQSKTALEFFETFTDKDPYSKEAWYNLGALQNKLEKYAEATQSFEYATLIDNNFGKGYLAMGHAFMNMKQYKDAQNSYIKALDLEGESPDLLCSLAATYEYTKNFETALRYYRQASDMEYMWHEAWYGMGTTALGLEKWQQAVHFLTKACEIDAGNASYFLSLADAECQLGNIHSANEYYQKAENLACDEVRLWLNWSLLFYNEQNYVRAIEVIKQGIEEDTENAHLYYRLVVYLLCAGSFKEAFNHLEIGLSLDYDAHEVIYDFFPDVETQKILYQIIESHKPQ